VSPYPLTYEPPGMPCECESVTGDFCPRMVPPLAPSGHIVLVHGERRVIVDWHCGRVLLEKFGAKRPGRDE
jgi:hypothetical protein